MKVVQWVLMSVFVASAVAVSVRASAAELNQAGTSGDPRGELSAREMQEKSDGPIASAIADRRQSLRGGHDTDISAMIQARRAEIRAAKRVRTTIEKESTK